MQNLLYLKAPASWFSKGLARCKALNRLNQRAAAAPHSVAGGGALPRLPSASALCWGRRLAV